MPHPVTLATARLTLREFNEADVDALLDVYGDRATTEHLSFSPRTHEQVQAILTRVVDSSLAAPRVDYTLAVCLGAGDGPLIGAGRLALGRPDADGPAAGLDPDSDAAQFGLAIRADHWGHGYGREALGLLLDYAFGALGVETVWGARGPANLASTALMDGSGFTETFTISGHVTKNGIPRDSIVHTLGKAEWFSRPGATARKGSR